MENIQKEKKTINTIKDINAGYTFLYKGHFYMKLHWSEDTLLQIGNELAKINKEKYTEQETTVTIKRFLPNAVDIETGACVNIPENEEVTPFHTKTTIIK